MYDQTRGIWKVEEIRHFHFELSSDGLAAKLVGEGTGSEDDSITCMSGKAVVNEPSVGWEAYPARCTRKNEREGLKLRRVFTELIDRIFSKQIEIAKFKSDSR